MDSIGSRAMSRLFSWQILRTMTVSNAVAAQACGGRLAKLKKAKNKKAKRSQTKHKTVKRKKAKGDRALTATTKNTNAPKPALEPRVIFDNERRPILVAAIRANGEMADAADIDRRITALWYAETHTAKYHALARVDRQRYADERAAFDWEGGAAAPVTNRQAATLIRERAASFTSTTRPSPASDGAPVERASLSAAATSVYSHAVSYLQPFSITVNGYSVEPQMVRHQRTRWAALQLMAAACGPLRAPTCNHTLRVASGEAALGQALLRRALLLLGPGELQELRPFGVAKGACDLIQSLLEDEAARSRLNVVDAAPHYAPVTRALASLRVLEGESVPLPVALIQQCAATLTELGCTSLHDGAARVLPLCTRLESLTLHNWHNFPPASWLGLSQLHTLRGVSLSEVPAATIAAALPRLHTLHVQNVIFRVEFPVAPFYDELLPRLRSFRLGGAWPETSNSAETVDAPSLPLLEDLHWCERHLPRQFMGARPLTLVITAVALVNWLKAADAAGADSSTATSPLARVRELTLRLGEKPPDAAFMSWLLRAAPQLRQFTFDVYRHDHVRWILSDEFTPEPAFAGLAHLRLRHIAVIGVSFAPGEPAPDGVRLRQRHFPRLRRLTVDGEEQPVWFSRRAGRRRPL
jgi:hypothetical protein